MKLEYALNEEDYIRYQLFIASRSERVARNRRSMWLLFPVVYGIIGVGSMMQANMVRAILFWALAAIWLIFYPVWFRRRYERHYKNHVRELYKDHIGSTVVLELGPNEIVATDEGSEVKIKLSELEAIFEIPSLFILRLRAGSSFLVPLDRVAGPDALRNYLVSLSKDMNISFTQLPDWRWR